MKKYIASFMLVAALCGAACAVNLNVNLNVVVNYPSGCVPPVATVQLTEVTKDGHFIADEGRIETQNGLVTFTNLVVGHFYQLTATQDLASINGEPGQDLTIWATSSVFKADKVWVWKPIVMIKHPK